MIHKVQQTFLAAWLQTFSCHPYGQKFSILIIVRDIVLLEVVVVWRVWEPQPADISEEGPELAGLAAAEAVDVELLLAQPDPAEPLPRV